MTRAVLLAFVAAGAGVLAAWEGLAAIERGRAGDALARVAAPLRRARTAGELPTAPERRRLVAVAAASLLAAGWIVFGPIGGLVLAVAGPPVVLAVVRARRRNYLAELERDAPAVARALADALSGGHSIRGAVAEAARALPGAAGAEYRRAAGALVVGEPTEAVLERVRTRARSPAYDTMVAAMLLQREAGGDLAGLLRELAASLEEARRLEGDARGATAQARFTGLLVCALPLGAFALAELASPGYVARLLGSPLSGTLLALSVVLQLLAFVAIHRLARVRE